METKNDTCIEHQKETVGISRAYEEKRCWTWHIQGKTEGIKQRIMNVYIDGRTSFRLGSKKTTFINIPRMGYWENHDSSHDGGTHIEGSYGCGEVRTNEINKGWHKQSRKTIRWIWQIYIHAIYRFNMLLQYLSVGHDRLSACS